jgi:hypothetical protein
VHKGLPLGLAQKAAKATWITEQLFCGEIAALRRVLSVRPAEGARDRSITNGEGSNRNPYGSVPA